MTDQELRMYCVEQVAKWGQASGFNPDDNIVLNRALADEAQGVYCFIKAQHQYALGYSYDSEDP